MKQVIAGLCYAFILPVLLFSCKKDSISGDGSANRPDLDIIETNPPVQVAVSEKISDNCFGFYRALPARYDSTSKKYPLLIFLHGSGEMGNGTTDLPLILRNSVPKLISQKKFPANFNVGGKNFSFIVFSPQVKAITTNDDIYAMIKYAVSHYRIDTTRIYVTGLSLGGGATWSFAAKYPELAAAIVPICGGITLTQVKASSIANAHLAVWAFHNEDDNLSPVKATKDNVNLINTYNASPKAKMTIWSTGKHDAWTKASDPGYKENNMNMYEWMLQYHK